MRSDTTPRPWAHLSAPERLRRWRQKIQKVTQWRLANDIGIDHTKYNGFETGRRRPSLDVAARIEEVTNGYVLATQWAQPLDLDRRRSRVA